jgi:isoleucyl-tRNA synthetase
LKPSVPISVFLILVKSSYTPFLTENIYQSLRAFIPEDPSAGDTRSVHFLLFPDVKEEYFDPTIERQVKRMQTVIELTRNIRERNNLSLKVCTLGSQSRRDLLTVHLQTPLKELLVFHPDREYLEDVRSLLRYVQSELNVRDVMVTSEETTAGVRYRAVADWAVLGRKLRNNLSKVKSALPGLSSDDVRSYMQTGRVTVAGIELVEGDLIVQRYIDLPEGAGAYATQTDNDVVVRLDIQVHPDLAREWLAREFISRVQKLRKKAGLQATDDVEVYYQFEEANGTDLPDAVHEHAEVIERTVRSVPADVSRRREGSNIIIEEEQEIAETKFLLSLVRP